jgi:hypothetical protein
VAAQQLRCAGRFRRPSMTRMVAHPREYPPIWAAVRSVVWLLALRPKWLFGTCQVRMPRLVQPVNVRRTGGFGWLQFVDANEIEIAERGP